MPDQVPLILTALRKELEELGLANSHVDCESLDQSGDTFAFRVINDAFEGQTFLDREMRVRPAIARALAAGERPKAQYVVEVLTPEEALPALDDTSVPEIQNDQDKINKKLWRDRKLIVAKVLRSSGYYIEDLAGDDVLVASKAGLATTKTLIGFAQSPSASTVDLGIRETLETARRAEKYAATYYVTPHVLDHPFANQKAASWLSVVDVAEFIHTINNSEQLVQAQLAATQVEANRTEPEHQGEVVEPNVHRETGEQIAPSFFGFIDDWVRLPKPSLLVLMAPAGHGKTTLTTELTRRFAEGYLSGYQRRVPLLVPFESVRRTVDFEALMHKRFAHLHAGAFGAFEELLKQNEAVLFVDGFDELADDAGVDVAEFQVRSMRPLFQGHAKVVLAGRSAFAQQFAGQKTIIERVRTLLGDIDVQAVEIEPFDDDQILKYVRTRKNLQPAAQQSVTRFAGASPDHAELCGNPLFLRLLCSLAVAGKMPQSDAVVEGADALIERVCEREEHRQQLGIGVPAQVKFLGEAALEIFRSGSASVAIDDLRVLAESTRDENPGAPNEVVGRLLDHAFITMRTDGRVVFIHPFVRDILLGRSVTSEIAQHGWDRRALALRDLPAATVQYLARHADKITPLLPKRWLSAATSLDAPIRRNAFRIAVASTRYRNPGNPRFWIESDWTSDNVIQSLDFGFLALESLSFDGAKFRGCEFEGVLLEDCDFRGTKFVDCALSTAYFRNCRADSSTDIQGGEFAPVTFESEHAVIIATDWATAREALELDVNANLARPPKAIPPDVAPICQRLLHTMLDLFMDVVAMKFFVRSADQLRIALPTHVEKQIFDKAISPLAMSTFCDKTYGGGSKELFSINKRWRNSLAEYRKTNRMTENLEEVFSRMVARAARYA